MDYFPYPPEKIYHAASYPRLGHVDEDIKALERFPPREPQKGETVLPTPGRYVKIPLGSDGGKDFLASRLDHYHKTIDGKDEVIKCSILDREKGYIHEPGDLPDELSYPILCILTFYDIPDIENPPMPTTTKGGVIYHTEYTDHELEEINRLVNKEYGTIYPMSAKTIKKYREQEKDKPGVVPYCHQSYEETPIGDLLGDHPVPGRAALHDLFGYFLHFYFEGKKYCVWPREPTRKIMVRAFQNTPSLAGVKFPNEDLAEKRFDLLVDYGIIKGCKGYTNQKRVIYYATQKSGPHQKPKEPCNDTRYHYILNNKTWDNLSPSEAFRAMFQ